MKNKYSGDNNGFLKLIGYRLKKDILGSSKGTMFMPGNEWIEAVFEGDEYWDNKSDEKVLAEWISKSLFPIMTFAREPDIVKRLQSITLASRLLETFDLDVSKIREGK